MTTSRCNRRRSAPTSLEALSAMAPSGRLLGWRRDGVGAAHEHTACGVPHPVDERGVAAPRRRSSATARMAG